MAVVAVKFDFEMRGYGWSEQWFKDTQQTALAAFYGTTAEPLGDKRRLMLAEEARLTAITCSFVADKQDSYLRYVNMPGAVGVHSDDAWSAVLTTFRSNNDRYRKNMWFRGQDDDVIMLGGNFQPGASTFVGPGTTFCNTLRDNDWGWMHRTPSITYNIVDYTPDIISGNIILTTTGGPFTGIAEGTYIRVSVLFKGVKTRLNGTWTMQVLGNNSIQTLKPMAVFPFSKIGQLRKFDFALVTISNWNFQKSGRRAPGKPLLHTPGHAKPTPLG